MYSIYIYMYVYIIYIYNMAYAFSWYAFCLGPGSIIRPNDCLLVPRKTFWCPFDVLPGDSSCSPTYS